MSAAIGILGMPPQRGPHWTMRRWCRGRHQRYPQNTPAETQRQTQPSDPRPSRSCQRSAARRRGQCPKPRRIAIAVGAQRRGIDGAEHSAKIERVMAGGLSDQGKRNSCRENVRDIRVRFRLELPCGCVRNRRALPAQILSGTRDVSDPLWNALGVNLRGQGGGRSRLAHGTIRRLGRHTAPPSRASRRLCSSQQGPREVRVRSRVVLRRLPRCAFSLCFDRRAHG